MLDDPRANALVDNFAMKWLNLDDLEDVDPTPGQFPGYSNALRDDFGEEARRFLASILLADQPVTELMNADHTFLNERLARHYGIDSVYGAQFRRVELGDERRWGLLGKSAVLLRTSYGDRTSPVLRGDWVLEKLMGTPSPPAAPQCGNRSEYTRRAKTDHFTCTTGRASGKSELQPVSWRYRSYWFGAGKLHRYWRLARHGSSCPDRH